LQGKLSARFYDSGFHTVTPGLGLAFFFPRTCELEGMFKGKPPACRTPGGVPSRYYADNIFPRSRSQRCSRLIASKENALSLARYYF